MSHNHGNATYCSTTTPDESTLSSTASPEASDETTIIDHQESGVPVIINSILGATNRRNKHATVPLLTFTINKKVVTVSEETIAFLLQRSVDLMIKFISTSTMGLWEGYPSSNLNTLPTRARDYLSTIIPLYDLSKGEANAIKLATAFLSKNRQTLDDLKDEHTQLVIDFGFDKALDIINSKCSYGFTSTRCDEWFTADPEYELLQQLASKGAHIHAPTGFINQIEPVLPRKNQTRLYPVYLACGLKWALASHALILHTSKLPIAVKIRMHQNCLSWAPKQEGMGRLCIDKSNHPSSHVLNTDESKLMADTMWGVVTLPSIGSIIHGLLQAVNISGIPLKDWSCVKEDVTSAYKQILRSHDAALLTSCSVDTDTTVMDGRVDFGGNDSAQVFYVLTRAVSRAVTQEAISKHLDFYLAVFVDDGMGFSPDTHIQSFREIYIRWWTRACGPKAINADKSIDPTKNPIIIGYIVDLENSTVRPDKKCMDKLFILLFCVYKHNEQMSLRDRQSIASMCERAAHCMRGMTAWLGPIHSMCKGKPHSLFTPNSTQRQAIEFFQASILTVFDRPELMTVPLTYIANAHNNVENNIQYIFRSDASELAATLSIWSPDGTSLLMWSRIFFNWGKDSQFSSTTEHLGGSAQNLREFLPIGLMMIMLSNSNLPSHNANVAWHGDNTAALTWASNNRCKADQPASQRAFVAFSLIQRVTEISLSHTKQLRSEDMGTTDLISRTSDDDLVDWDHNLKVDIDMFPTIRELVDICNPHITGNLDSHHEVYTRVSDIMLRAKNRIPNGKPHWP